MQGVAGLGGWVDGVRVVREGGMVLMWETGRESEG